MTVDGRVMDDRDLGAQLDDAEAQARITKDTSALADLWADQLVVTTPGGTSADKSTALRLVGTGGLSYGEIVREHDRVVQLERVLVTAGWETVRTAGGRRQYHRYTHVWMRHDKSWQLIARHASLTDRHDRARPAS